MVSVGLPATTVAAVGLPLVRRIRESYPSILLNVVEGMRGHIGQLMRLGQLDLALLFSNDVAPDANNEPLMIQELFLMIPENRRLVPRARTPISLLFAAAWPLNPHNRA